jgi:hypothetical protein
MSRFAPLPSQRKGTATEPINWGDPGDHRNRGKGEALVPSTDPKYAQRDPAFRPLVPASSTKATASTSTTAAPVAKAKSNAPAKSAATIAAEQANARINAVMDSSASTGKKKSASKLLLHTKASASDIIAQLNNLQPDAIREQAEADAMWQKATANANALAGFNVEPVKTETAPATGWAKVVTRVNALNGFEGNAA